MSDCPLGNKLEEGCGERDAIHIAIAPVIANQRLRPGQKIGFVDQKNNTVGVVTNSIGIVDPFLPKPVRPGERFYICLFPQTVTGMRHHWQHPEFDKEAEKDEYRLIAEQIATELDYTYEELMDVAIGYEKWDNYEYDNTESYKDIPDELWDKFWTHYENVTGRKVDRKYGPPTPFTCSC